MANCEKCDLKLNFSNNFGGICEGCYDKRLRGGKGNVGGKKLLEN